MDPKRWQAVQAAFHRALELSRPERLAHLERLAERDAELAADVGRMLDAQDSVSGFAEPPDAERILREMSPADYLEGQRIGDFELEGELGRGGMGIVYRARQVSLDRLVAVKVLPPAMASSKLRIERFHREALAASKLHHPGLAPPIAFGEADGLVYYAMRLVSGPSLQELCVARKEGREHELLPKRPKPAARFAVDLLETLDAVHAEGLVHRDVKPGNLILSPAGPVLIDFGLAKDFELDDLTRSGEPSGTPFYMSPEQVRAERNQIDLRTDVYSVGAVLFELLTGAPPFTGKGTAEVFHKITRDRPSRMGSGVPRALELIVRKALAKAPAERYASAGAMARDLVRFLDGQQVEARPPSLAKEVQQLFRRRRALVFAMPAVLVAGLFGHLLSPAPGRDQGLAQVTIDLGSSAVAAPLSLTAWRYTDPFGAQARLERGPSKIEHADSLELRPGVWRFCFEAPDGRAAEWIETLAPGADVALGPRAFATPTADAGMVAVPGGTLGLGPIDGPQSSSSEGLPRFTVQPFALDQALVTNGAFRAAFEAAGDWPPVGISESHAEAWETRPVANWDQLPVTGIPRQTARLYAALVGKRLATQAELSLALELTRPDWDPARANLAPGETRDFTSMLGLSDYVAGARPASVGARPVGPLGLRHPFGNVRCFVEGLLPAAADSGLSETVRDALKGRSHASLALGAYWRDGVVLVTQRERPIGIAFMLDEGALNVGFRCARSLPEPKD